MTSMTKATTAEMAARNPSLRKDKRELLKGVQRVTTDPNDLVQSDNEEGLGLQTWREIQVKPSRIPTKIHHHYLQVLK